MIALILWILAILFVFALLRWGTRRWQRRHYRWGYIPGRGWASRDWK